MRRNLKLIYLVLEYKGENGRIKSKTLPVSLIDPIVIEFYLTPLQEIEIKTYIQHRVKVAGRNEELFTDDAYKRIAELSDGTPRKINILCDLVLVYGYSSEEKIIDVDLVNEVIKDKERYGVFSGNNEKLV